MQADLNMSTSTSDNDFENIVDISPIPILIHKMGLVLYMNSFCIEMLEYDNAKQIIGKNLLDLVYPEDKQKLIDAVTAGIKDKKQNAVLETRMISGKGNIIKTETKSSTVHFRGDECRLAVVYNYNYIAKVEEDLKNKNLLIEKIAELIPDSLIVVESKSRNVLFENKPLMQILGYTQQDLNGVDQFEFITGIIHKDDVPKLLSSRKFLFDPANTGKYISTEYRIKDKSGKWRWILARSTVFKSTDDGTQQINFGISQDITQLKEIEQQLLESKNFSDKVTATVPAHISIYNIQNGKVEYANTPFCVLMGYSLDEEPENILEYFHPDFRKYVTESFQKISSLIEGETATRIMMYITKSGETKHMLSRVTPFTFDEAGKLKTILTTLVDVTDLKETELKLQLSEETRKAVLSALPDLIFQVSKTGIVQDLYANDTYRNFLEEMDLVGKHVSEILPEKDCGIALSALHQAIETGTMQTGQYIHPEKQQNLYYEFRISRLNNESGIIVVRDITNLITTQTQLDQKLEELSQKNEELEKYITSNTELEKFAYIASHDLREPLRSIVGFAQLIQKRNADKLDKESSEFLEKVIDSGQRMNLLIHGLLDYSKVTSAGRAFDQVNMLNVLEKVRSDIQAQMEESKAELIVTELPEVNGDELQLRQLLQNLVSNGIKFSRANIRPVIQVRAEKNKDIWTFAVQDNGIGLDMRYKEKVFQIFSRLHTSDKYHGSGIGLAVCKRIVERHGGNIWLDSTPGKGTTVYFTIASGKS